MSTLRGRPTMSLGANLVSGNRRWIVYGLGAVLLLATTQQFASLPTDDLTSSGTWAIALAWSVPILMAGLGGIFSERSGVVNIGLEGMLILGTWFGAFGTMIGGPWFGMLLAAVAGAVGGLVMAVAAVGFNVDHIIAGVAINLMAPGLTRFLSDLNFSDRGGSITQSPTISGVSNFTLPVLAGGTIFGWESPDVLGAIERAGIFFISDLAGILRGFMFQMSWLTLIAYLALPISILVLWKTSFGLRLRSCGEHPHAADSLGVNVYKYKYYGVVISGFLAGFGGGFLAIVLSGLYKEGQTQGKGYIGLATMIFGNWNPVGTARGALLFGFTETLRLRDENAAHGLLLLVVIALALLLLWRLRSRRGDMRINLLAGAAGLIALWYSFFPGQITRLLLWVALVAIVVMVIWHLVRWLREGRVREVGVLLLALVAVVMGLWYGNSTSVPNQLPAIIPHIAVLVVLLFATSRLRPPAADGLPFRKGET